MFFKKRKLIKISRNIKKPIFLDKVNLKIFKKKLIFNFNSKDLVILLNNDLFTFNIDKNFLYFWFFENFKSNTIGTLYSIIKNIILGFIKFFYKKLTLVGVGYKALIQSKYLYLYLGYSLPIIYKIPETVNITTDNLNITISGVDKQIVNLISNLIRSYKLPDSYKGKGIIYYNEKLTLKTFKKS